MLTVTFPRSADHPISPFEGSPRAGAAEYVQGGDVNRQIVKPSHLPFLLTVTSFRPIDHPISPFEGGWGDVNRQIAKSPNRQIAKFANLLISQFANFPIC